VRHVLLLLALLATALPARAEEPSAPASVADLEKALDALRTRLEQLLKLAEKDKRLRRLETYVAYGPADFAEKRRDVEAGDLVEWLADADAPDELRQKAFDALTGQDAMRFDPDLKQDEGRGARKPRAAFATAKVIKLYLDRDAKTRELAHRLMQAWFPGHKMDPDILTYDPVGGNRANWQKAYNHWKKVLGR
jgi:hypothetical protein